MERVLSRRLRESVMGGMGVNKVRFLRVETDGKRLK
jgi:hypothetical protein